ncbi:MAG: hypothetical protein ACPL1A_07850 [Candidatus Kapaibacteriota bacterium]
MIEKPSSDITAYLYIFVPETECDVCDVSLQKIVNYFLEKKHIEIIIFYNSNDEYKLNNFKIDFPKECVFILDRLSAYSNFYKVKKLEFFYIVDRNGKILYFNKIKGSKIKDKEIEKLLAVKINENKLKPKIEEVSRILLMNNGNLLKANKLRTFLFSKRDSTFYFKLNKFPILYKSDKFGNTTQLIDTLDLIKNNIIIGYDLEWMVQDSLLLSFNISRDGYNLCSYNVSKNEYSRYLEIQYSGILAFNFANCNNQFIFAKGYPTSKTKPLSFNTSDHQILLYNSNGINIRNFGILSPLFQNNAFSCVVKNQIACNKNNEIIYWQNFTKYFEILDTLGNTLKKINLEMDTSFHANHETIPHDFNDSTWIYLRANYSFNYKILIDNNNPNVYAFVYYNNIDKNPNLPGYNYDQIYYMQIIDISTSKNINLEFPVNAIPFYLEGDYLFTSEINDKNELSLVKYKIKF